MVTDRKEEDPVKVQQPLEGQVSQVLSMMGRNLGEEPRPMALLSRFCPQAVLEQARDRGSTFSKPHIPERYKHLICVAVTSAVSSHLCTETFVKLAHRNGVTPEEIAEAIVLARFALGSTVFASAVEAMEFLSRASAGDEAPQGP
jgi:AhpD family alkylhydroperoxidase